MSVETVRNGVKSVRQLGVESCIGACYMLPKVWATTDGIGGLITSVVNKHQDVTSTFGGTWVLIKIIRFTVDSFKK